MITKIQYKNLSIPLKILVITGWIQLSIIGIYFLLIIAGIITYMII